MMMKVNGTTRKKSAKEKRVALMLNPRVRARTKRRLSHQKRKGSLHGSDSSIDVGICCINLYILY